MKTFKPETVSIKFNPNKYNKGKAIEVLEELIYIDSNKTKWIVPKGYKSDGASIPKWAQRFIGEPLEGDTLRAVLIHDVYCENKKRSQEDTHKVFREILKLDGVNLLIRNLMYQAVTKYNKIKNPFWN